MFAGGLFVLTAKTYAEGAAMFPEAGGSSSFARHAFNEVVSFFAGWALTLDYIITIAISAFFVPHYLGAFFPALTHNPGRHHRRADHDRAAGRAEHPRPRRVGQAQPLPGGRRPVHAGPARRRRVRARPEPVAAGQPGAPRHGAELDAADLRAVGGDGRLHRHRDRLEHGRGGQGPRPRHPQGGQPRAGRRARRLRRHLGRRALGAAGRPPRRATAATALGHDRSRTTRCSGSSRVWACTARC